MIIAGIDEAGYGPLLGPLVVSAAAFRVATETSTTDPLSTNGVPLPTAGDLWPRLSAAITRKAPVRDGKLIVADSKIIHALAGGLPLLEKAVLAFARLPICKPIIGPERCRENPLSIPATSLRQLLATLGESGEICFQQPWYDAAGALPRFAAADSIGPGTNLLTRALYTAEMTPAALRTTVIPEHEFNRLIGLTNNKASVLMGATFGHLAWLYQHFAAEDLLVMVDKQGGRDRYLDHLFESFPEARIKVLAETPALSGYVLTADQCRATFYFAPKAELKSFATALASMICKYLREVLMDDFNRWFGSRLENLRPTAGYYQDGQRWLKDIAPHLPGWGIDQTRMVRLR